MKERTYQIYHCSKNMRRSQINTLMCLFIINLLSKAVATFVTPWCHHLAHRIASFIKNFFLSGPNSVAPNNNVKNGRFE